MDHVLSTHLFVNHRLTTALLNRIEHAGILAVEIFCARRSRHTETPSLPGNTRSRMITAYSLTQAI